jgi:phosphopantetheinyl transferase (holo-ACP synthase)
MLNFRLTNTLNNSEDAQWKLLADRILGPNCHPSRVKGFCLAREALRACFSQEKRELKIEQLELDQYDLLTAVPAFTLSLSHTERWGAAVIAPRDQCRAVGIDIEPLHRQVKANILERISHPQDMQLSPIYHWAVKEACFKALMNIREFERPQEFSSLKISPSRWLHQPSGIEGHWQTEVSHDLIIALAWINH